MNCGVDGSEMPENLEEIFILDEDEEYSSYIKKLCMNVGGTSSVMIESRGTSGSHFHTEVNVNLNYDYLLSYLP